MNILGYVFKMYSFVPSSIIVIMLNDDVVVLEKIFVVVSAKK